MKTIKFTSLISMVSMFIIAACQRNVNQVTLPQGDKEIISNSSQSKESSGTCNPNAYSIVLESHSFVNGNWDWVWSVQNPNPGNGNNGTAQNLSHWGMQFGACFNWNSVIRAAYSADGTTWTEFTPSYGVDPSQGCMTTPVLKFDYGTIGNAKSYYRLTVSSDYDVASIPGYYKSGANTGCCTFTFNGIGCPVSGGDR